MNTSISTRNDVITQMKYGATVITPNNRLSQDLIREFLYTENTVVCTKPRCLPYLAFLYEVFKQVQHEYPSVSHPIVLNVHQQRYLWRSVLETSLNDSVHDGLLNEVQEAWARCQFWNVSFDDASFLYNTQTEQFQTWGEPFQNTLNDLNAITEEQLGCYLLDFPLSYKHAFIWICFDDYTPQQKKLQNFFEKSGAQQHHFDFEANANQAYQFIAKDNQDEWLNMVHWVKERMDLGDKSIAVVVPDLQASSKPLKRFLHQHFLSEQFNISLGEPLSTFPLVAHALNWLSLDRKQLKNHTARLLLHSPYLAGSAGEFNARAELLEHSKILQESIFPYSSLVKECQLSAPILANLLNNLSSYPNTATPFEWITVFKTRLHQLGFPGEYSLDSATYQCFHRFNALLEDFLHLTVVTPKMNRHQAMEALKQLAKDTIFQVKKSPCQIQFLGLLEASGCVFDSVWICGLTDQCLPQKTKLSAFIPLELQRKLKMPHALPERELLFAQKTLSRLQNGSQLSIFSYPEMVADIPHLPSPLIDSLPVWESVYIERNQQSELVSYHETYLIPLHEEEKVSGGTALLANQAKCPFRAFAMHRLRAKDATEVNFGPDLSERGQIVHKVMDILWNELKTQHNLLSLSDEELEYSIEKAIFKALSPLTELRPYSFSPLIQDVELSRLKALVHDCLAWDKQRAPFEVEALEQEFSIQLSGIDFKVRVDRLDKVGDSKWVIDYKSSLPGRTPWNDERPEEPQLLLYALLDKTINTLLFLQLKAGRFDCHGLSEESLSIKGIHTLNNDEPWAMHQSSWFEKLTKLANEFSSGHCVPNPSKPSLCHSCEIQPLCRTSTE